MQYYKNTLCVEYGFLMENGIMSDGTYRRLVDYGVLNRIRRACRETPALVTYDSLPCRFQAKVTGVVPDPHRVARINMVEDHIRHSAEAAGFFDDYTLADGRHLPRKARTEYYTNAIVLDAIKAFITVKREKRASLNKRMVRSWDQLAEYVQDVDRGRFPHNLPDHPRRLEDKFLKYRKEGYISLIHKNFLNENAAKVNDAYMEGLLVELLADGHNLDNEQIAKFYNMTARKMNRKEITGSAVGVWRERYMTGIYAGRRGVKAFDNRIAMQVKRSAPSFPLYFWTLDGWDVELLYRKFENGHTTYHNRPTVVIVLDACGKYPVGYAVGTHETPGLIREALRDAVRHTESLFGGMYRTQQIQSDRYSIKSMTPVYESVSERYTPARAHNAKAKVVEPYFGSINRDYCQPMPNWSGFGITGDRERQPNAEALQARRASFPDFDGVVRQVGMIIECERSKKAGRYVELFGKMPGEHKVPLKYDQYLMGFGSTTGYRNTLQGNGLKVTIEGVKYDYDCFDLGFRDHFSVKWEVRYDPADLRRVLAVNEDESLRFMLEEKYVQPMALIERKEGDYEQLERVRDYNERLKEKVTDFRAASGSKVAELFEIHPELDTLKKLLITDSRGQHKDRINQLRITNYELRKEEEDELRLAAANCELRKAGEEELREIDIYDMY